MARTSALIKDTKSPFAREKEILVPSFHHKSYVLAQMAIWVSLNSVRAAKRVFTFAKARPSLLHSTKISLADSHCDLCAINASSEGHRCVVSMLQIMFSVLLDFWLTVKAATLIFISGCGLAISSAKEGKSGFIYNLVKSLCFLSRANVRAFHENPNRIHTELTFINP